MEHKSDYITSTSEKHSNYNDTTTETLPTKPPGLKLAFDILVPAFLTIVMFSMGCGITLKGVKAHLRRPIGPAIGMLSQFLVMPAVAFGLAHALGLQPYHAIGMVIVASCPGGSTFNLFTYGAQVDLPLSICMTMLSTVLALGFMPLNMFIYLHSWANEQADIPFVQIVIIIVLTWIPVLIGMLIRHKFRKAATYIAKIGSAVNLAIIISLAAMQSHLYPEFWHFPWNFWLGTFSHNLIGFALGFVLASIASLQIHQCRAIAFETGMQNSGLGLTLVIVSFEGQKKILYSQYPLMYSAIQTVNALALTAVHVIFFWVRSRIQRRSEMIGEGDQVEEAQESAPQEIQVEKLLTPEVETAIDGGPLIKGNDLTEK